ASAPSTTSSTPIVLENTVPENLAPSVESPALPQSASAPSTTSSTPIVLENTVPENLAPSVESPALPHSPLTAATAEPSKWQTVEVKNGDSMALIFSRLQLSSQALHEIIHLNEHTRRLRHIRPKEQLKFHIDRATHLQAMQYRLNMHQTLVVKRGEDSFTAYVEDTPPEIIIQRRHVRIDDSLYMAGVRSGLSEKLIMELANIFGWDIDFALDIRAGDKFTLIYEELYRENRKIGTGNILAAEFWNRDRQLRAVRYTNTSKRTDYFTPKGDALRKAFLRTPVDFTRISSKFNLKRKHPILKNVVRPHQGVDYAAPINTPVKATGDGIIEFLGTKGHYGKTVIIRHAGTYHTLYAHLSRFAKGIRKSHRIKQGEIIAYVGTSGLSTGPHLHYEFRVNGVHKDPLKVKLPKAKRLLDAEFAEFKQQTQLLLAALENASTADLRIALNKKNENNKAPLEPDGS
ncbi:MAG: OapA family protein, partial [Candidatus Eutrophobiaceae bacterium]